MAFSGSAVEIIKPSFHDPDIIFNYNQVSNYPDALADGEVKVKLSPEDLVVYFRNMNMRTRTYSAQSPANELPGVDITMSLFSVMTYLFRMRCTYSHHDINAANNWGFSLPDAYRLGMLQGHFQHARDAAIHGLQPENGEGLLNIPGNTDINLPPDQYNNTTALTYDPGAFAKFFLQQIALAKTRTNQLGRRGRKITILGPQRVLGLLENNLVELTSYQRPGAGSESTKGTIGGVIMKNGDELVWGYDDTLQGAKGDPDTDYVLIVIPELDVKNNDNPINTNAIAGLPNAFAANVTQYADTAAPTEINSQLPDGVTGTLTEWRITPAIIPRPQAVSVIAVPYS